MTKVAFILRGYHILDSNSSGIRYSQKFVKYYNFIEDILNNFYSYIYIPFKYMDYDVDYYFITYESALQDKLSDECLKLIPNMRFKFLPLNNNSRSITLLYEGINFVKNMGIYDRYIIARNDMFYKKPINMWLPKYINDDHFYYLFDELTYNSGRISDNLLCIDSNIDKYIEILNICLKNRDIPELSEQHNNFHGILPIVKTQFNKYSAIVKGCGYDTNTSYPWGTSKNPVYKLAGREYHYDD